MLSLRREAAKAHKQWLQCICAVTSIRGSDLSGQFPAELYECQSVAVKDHACSVDCPCINKSLTRLKVCSPASSPREAMWLIIPDTVQKFCQILPLSEPHQLCGRACKICPEGGARGHKVLLVDATWYNLCWERRSKKDYISKWILS